MTEKLLLELTVGIIGGLLGVILFLPQLFKTIKTKSAKDLSFFTYLLILINLSFWAYYGILINNPIIIIPNIIGAIISSIMLVLVRYYRHD